MGSGDIPILMPDAARHQLCAGAPDRYLRELPAAGRREVLLLLRRVVRVARYSTGAQEAALELFTPHATLHTCEARARYRSPASICRGLEALSGTLLGGRRTIALTEDVWGGEEVAFSGTVVAVLGRAGEPAIVAGADFWARMARAGSSWLVQALWVSVDTEFRMY